MQLDKDSVEEIQKRLKEISEAKTDYDIFRDFIISCRQSNNPIPDKIKAFIISELFRL